ncbi:MAG TPA: hypothetical protein VGM93_00025 [Acidimicrobiales bacterium]
MASDPRDLARRWLVERLREYAVTGYWDERDFPEIAAAILDQSGVEVVRVGHPLGAGRLVITLPAEVLDGDR